MIIALDSNVISEMVKPAPDPQVLQWVARQPRNALVIPSICVAELSRGLNSLPAGHRRRILSNALTSALAGMNVVDFHSDAAQLYGKITTVKGHPVPTFDALIAATCITHDVALATRNIKDFIPFEPFGLHLINPWEG